MSQALPSSPRALALPAAWRRPLALLLLLLCVVLVAYRDTAVAMVGIWQRSDTFAHAFIVPPIALWLIWRRRFDLAALTPQAAPLALLPLALAVTAWLLGELVAVNALTQAALVAMLVSCVPLALGWRVCREIAFPLAFLFFSVPVGEFMMPSLMESTADFTVTALRLSGIPVYREGLQFIIPSGNWSVVEACSGLRYLIASVMVGTLFAYLNYRSLRRRLVFIVVATLLPLVANWLRAYMIVMLGHLSSNQLATGADHLVYGWVFFGLIMMAMFLIGARWAEPELGPQQTEVARQSLAPQKIEGAAWPWLGLACVLVPHMMLHAVDELSISRAPVSLELQLNGWLPQSGPLSDWKPAFQRPAFELQQSFGKQTRTVGLHIAYYRHQSYDSKLISSANQLAPSSDKRWVRTASGTVPLTLGAQDLVVRGSDLAAFGGLAGEGVRLRAWQFYWIGGRLTSSDLVARLYGALQRLSGQGDDAASVIVYTLKGTDNGAETDEVLRSFLSSNWQEISASLDRARAARD